VGIGRIVIALTIVSSILAGTHYYLWARLVRDPALGSPWSGRLTWLLAGLAVGIVLGFVMMRVAPRSVASPFLWVVFTWMGLLFYLFLLLAISDAGMVALAMARRATSGEVDLERRVSMARIVAAAVSTLALGLTGFGMASALGRTAVKKVTVPLAKLPPGQKPYTLVQVSDIHVGPTIGLGFLREIVDEVNALEPDVVVITGDLVDGSVEQLGALTAPLKELRAKDGVFFVTGNHEYYSGVDEWLAYLGQLGIRVLRNERVPVGPIDLAGVDDWSARSFGHGHGADLPKALAGRDKERPVVLLAHQPQAIVEAEQHGVDLQLSGHTHGGQMFPWVYAVKLVTPYVAGLYQHKTSTLYVSRGTGYWGPPVRVGAPAEITHLTLVPT
jgi:predicted MPP superfamily phosphohydrolase